MAFFYFGVPTGFVSVLKNHPPVVFKCKILISDELKAKNVVMIFNEIYKV